MSARGGLARRRAAVVPTGVACTVMLLAAPAALAQHAPLRLTLNEAIVRAEGHSQRLAEGQARVDVAGAVQAGLDAADRPAVSVNAGYTRTNHVDEFALPLPGGPPRVLYPDVPDNYRLRLDLQWPIYTAGRLDALERAASAERDAARFDLAAARADLRLETARAFWALVTARRTEEVLSRALTTVDAHVADLRSRLEQGLIPPNEVMTAEAQRSHQRVLAIEAANLRRVADGELRRLVGAPGAEPIEPVADLAGVSPAPTPGSAFAFEEARATRPERRALASRTAAAREREAAVAAGGRPQLAVGAGYDYARPNPRIFPRLDAWRESWDISVNVNWSLWDGGRRSAERAEAAAGTRALAARAADFDTRLAFELEQRRLELESAEAAIDAAAEGVGAAAEARRVVAERFDVGVATSTDVLDAETAILRAELDHTRAVANARLAAARLERAIGR